MKLENQYCTAEQGKRLVELGIDPGPLVELGIDPGPPRFYWATTKTYRSPFLCNDWMEEYAPETVKAIGPAFSVAELGVMLGSCAMESSWEGVEAQWRAAQLIELLEQKFLTPAECNERLRNA